MTTEPRNPPKPVLSAAGCRNVILVLIALAVVGALWLVRSGERTPAVWVGPVAGYTGIVLFLTAFGLIVNARAILDWFVVRHPPEPDHPVLGPVRYAGLWWRGEADGLRFGIEGGRRGPDPAQLEALAYVVSHRAELEPRAREFARAAVPETLQELLGLYARRTRSLPPVEVDMDFAIAGEEEDCVRVTLHRDEPVAAERH